MPATEARSREQPSMAKPMGVAASAVAQPRKAMRVEDVIWKVVLYVALAVLSLSFLMPLLWMISTSLKDTDQTYRVPPIWIPWPMRFENYPEAMVAQPF